MVINSKNSIFIIANWKMNPVSFIESENLLKTIKKGIKKNENVNIVICPPAIYLSKIKSNSSFKLGIQNIFWEDGGAYTGEISAKMAKEMKVNYTLIGHSERRKFMRETNEMINLKIMIALKNKLKPILCLGETLEEKKKELTSKVIANQIETALKDIKKSQVSNLIIAYEPIWAIGTGQIPSADEIMSAALLIKKIISKLYNREIAEKVFILYGGSVNSKNAFNFVDKTGVHGLLIGGASLNGSEFVRIVNLFK